MSFQFGRMSLGVFSRDHLMTVKTCNDQRSQGYLLACEANRKTGLLNV